jgi:hypothetical protein
MICGYGTMLYKERTYTLATAAIDTGDPRTVCNVGLLRSALDVFNWVFQMQRGVAATPAVIANDEKRFAAERRTNNAEGCIDSIMTQRR